MRRAGEVTRPAGDWCLLLGLLVKSNLTINWWLVLVAGGWWLVLVLVAALTN